VRRPGIDRAAGILRVLAGAACLPALCLAAYLSLPWLRPGIEEAAFLSARLSFPLEGDTLSDSSGEALETSSEQTPRELPDLTLFPAESAPQSGEEPPVPPKEDVPPQESSQEEASEPEVQAASAEIKPANAGTVLRRTYEAGNGSMYIPINGGYIKNCTSHTAEEVLSAAEASLPFSLERDGEPEVLIMHTHATEAYQPQKRSWYDPDYGARSTELSENTCAVGEAIAAQLRRAGIGVLHDTTLHDYPSYNGAYERSAETVKAYLEQYPSIKVVLDVHRDAIQADGSTIIAPCTTIDGRDCAQVMIISGCDNGSFDMPDYMENLAFAAALQRQMETDYPTLTRPVLFDYRKYNQDLTTGSLLLEVGGHANTLEEALYCGSLVGKSLAKLLEES